MIQKCEWKAAYRKIGKRESDEEVNEEEKSEKRGQNRCKVRKQEQKRLNE